MIKIACQKCGFEKNQERPVEFCPHDGTLLRLKSKPESLEYRSSIGQGPIGPFARSRIIQPSELIDASTWFDNDSIADQDAYEEALRFDWKDIDEASLDQIKQNAIRFLNRWRAFGPYPIKPTDELANAIKRAFSDVSSSLESLWNQTIEDARFQESRQISENASRVFYRFSDIGMRFREVAASKLLHMVIPQFFVMWDNTIMEAYGLRRAAYGSDFLPLMNSKINQTIELAMQQWKSPREDAIHRLRYRGKTLAKIIDEFNYKEYTREKRHHA